jgi:AbrB family looped-hinge helix DNA binding protein
MPRVKVHRDDQITLPPEARQKLDVGAGDFLDVEVVAEGVLLKPVPEDRHPDVDAEITEGLADIRARRVTPAFESMEEFEVYRQTDAYKRFIRDRV